MTLLQHEYLCIHCRLDTADQLPVLDVESKSSSAASQVLNLRYAVHVYMLIIIIHIQASSSQIPVPDSM